MFYRGKSGQWAWILHRLTGVGVLLFLFAHILDTMLVGFGPRAYNAMLAIYRNPFFKVNEVVLFGAVLYHSLNGVRIIVIDFWPKGAQYQKQIFYATMAVFVLSMIPVSIIMLSHLFR